MAYKSVSVPVNAPDQETAISILKAEFTKQDIPFRGSVISAPQPLRPFSKVALEAAGAKHTFDIQIEVDLSKAGLNS